MPVRFARAPSASFLALFRPGALLAPLTRPLRLDYDSKSHRIHARGDAVYDAACAALTAVPELAAPPPPPATNKIDLLALDDAGHLVLVEAKHHAQGKRAYFAPLQVLRYLAEWQAAFDADGDRLLADLRALIDAKEAVGLCPPGLAARVGPRTRELRAAIVFGDPPSRRMKSHAGPKLDAVHAALLPVARDHGLSLETLKIWAWPDAATAPNRWSPHTHNKPSEGCEVHDGTCVS